MLIYVMEVDDIERSKQAGVESQHPIDAEHKRVMQTAVGEVVPGELLLDLRLDE